METKVVALPDDVLTDVLCRVPPWSLAAVRCVCKAWRAIVDARGLLLSHLLPHSVRGIFVNYIDHNRPHLFARPSAPSMIPRIDGMLGFMPNDHKWDWDKCNPATQRWALFPQRAEARWGYDSSYLVFDPAMSPHYEVFLIPAVPEKPKPPSRWEAEMKRRALPRQQEMVGPFCLLWLFSTSDGAKRRRGRRGGSAAGGGGDAERKKAWWRGRCEGEVARRKLEMEEEEGARGSGAVRQRERERAFYSISLS